MNEPDDYLWDRSGPQDPEVARLEQLLSPLRHQAPLDEVRLARGRRRSRALWFALAGTAVAAVAAYVLWSRGVAPARSLCGESAGGFSFAALDGTVACEGVAHERGVLPVGGTIDTGAAQAELTISTIGSARLSPQTRVRLERTGPTRHQLFLERGRMHARVNAVERLFAVSTPSSEVVDLGCEYVLDIDGTGAGSIRMISGAVELETGTKRTVLRLPAGAHARLFAGRRVGLPIADGASAAFEVAVHRYEDTPSDPHALAELLRLADKRDGLTLAQLALLSDGDVRRQVLERLVVVSPAPQGLTVDEALADHDLFIMWFDEIGLRHLGVSPIP
jgi:hypothetical protein